MIVGSIKEDLTLEKRISLTPETAKNIIGLGLQVYIEKDYASHLGIQDNEYKKVSQIGNVILKDYVEIGANSTVDRATIGSTIINKGVKIDNLVQIAHNVEIGENTAIAGCVGIAGSAKIGKNCTEEN